MTGRKSTLGGGVLRQIPSQGLAEEWKTDCSRYCRFRLSRSARVTRHTTPHKAMIANKRTILLVDDEEATRSRIYRVLQSDGHDVFTAKDYNEDVATFRRHREEIDLLITYV